MPARDDIGKLAGISIKHAGGKVVITEVSKDEAPVEELTDKPSLKGVNPEEILIKVKRYYDGLWDRVKRQAEKSGYEEGFEKGYSEGYKKGLEEARAKIQEVVDGLSERISALDRELSEIEEFRLESQKQFESWLHALEDELLVELPSLVSEIVKTMLEKEIFTDREVLRSFLQKAFIGVRSAKRVEVRVPSEIIEEVKAVVSELRGILKEAKVVDVVAGEGIIIDTDVGVIDLRLEKISERLEELLRTAILTEDGPDKKGN